MKKSYKYFILIGATVVILIIAMAMTKTENKPVEGIADSAKTVQENEQIETTQNSTGNAYDETANEDKTGKSTEMLETQETVDERDEGSGFAEETQMPDDGSVMEEDNTDIETEIGGIEDGSYLDQDNDVGSEFKYGENYTDYEDEL